MTIRQVQVINPTGLHARPASELVSRAKGFASEITLQKAGGGNPFNAKSILRVLSEGIGQGTWIEIAAEGADEVQAAEALAALVGSGFGE